MHKLLKLMEQKRFSSTAFTFILLVVSSTASAVENRWPLPELQHQIFLNWAQVRKAQLKTSDEVLDQKADASLTPEEAAIKFNVPSQIDLKTTPLLAPTPERISELQKTSQLYFSLFGKNTRSSFLWSGIETGNTLTSNMDYRWNSLREAGFYDPKIRAQFIAGLKQVGIKNLRFGFSNHEIYQNPDGTWNQASWKAADEMIRDLTSAGIDLSLDLHHFGIESRFCVDSQGKLATYQKNSDELCDKNKYDPTKSFYLHSAWWSAPR